MDYQSTIYDAIAESVIGEYRYYIKDHWSSDWDGEDVGFPDVPVVGLYSLKDQPIDYYVDTETGVVLDAWSAEEVD